LGGFSFLQCNHCPWKPELPHQRRALWDHRPWEVWTKFSGWQLLLSSVFQHSYQRARQDWKLLWTLQSSPDTHWLPVNYLPQCQCDKRVTQLSPAMLKTQRILRYDDTLLL
jgi:hypothetical protein